MLNRHGYHTWGGGLVKLRVRETGLSSAPYRGQTLFLCHRSHTRAARDYS